jgi:hypothetical protein
MVVTKAGDVKVCLKWFMSPEIVTHKGALRELLYVGIDSAPVMGLKYEKFDIV